MAEPGATAHGVIVLMPCYKKLEPLSPEVHSEDLGRSAKVFRELSKGRELQHLPCLPSNMHSVCLETEWLFSKRQKENTSDAMGRKEPLYPAT